MMFFAMLSSLYYAVMMLLSVYLGIGLVALCICLIIVFSANDSQMWNNETIYRTLDTGSRDPTYRMVLDIFANRIGVMIILVLTWPYGLKLLFDGKKR